ncbi:protein NUCLEAR FUSION DEFECTIVE 4-like isoform X3 [Prunus avium]|uniref:Protein NUCLEAR FUSION DEFECTIVE 4-like isoform X1 n=2 Tax=Prunus avium TaxID=42229 RepID=A0A6P5S4E9_PRUAV|nr:protein NUCLEAR FUSION DEFECTIVE 4-like isoform X1 [Prunus avium]XP_021808371.1 protein NUCLEAR FUSION DEFECTIVE 4-like isoform X3 [Prunus avium]
MAEMERLSSKWTATAASIYIQSAAGSSYAFSIYSSALKSSQGYDQSTLDTVSVFKDIGANAGILSGILYSAVALNHRRIGGPWVVHAAGAIQCFLGYFFLWAAVTGLVERPPVAAVCLFMFLAAHAQTFYNTANVVTGVHNFSEYGGTIVGIMKGFLGLSSAMLVQVYDTFCKDKPSTFLLMLALLPTSVSILFMPHVRIYEAHRSDIDKKYLNAFSAFAMLIAAYLMVIIILKNIFSFTSWASIATFIALLVVLIASPLGIATKAQKFESKRLPETVDPLLENPEPRLASSKFSASGEPVEHEHEMLVDHLEDMNLLRAMGSVDFWLLFIAMICGMGSGLATINNMSQIGQSLGYTTVEINSFVSLWSIWNFLGRFGAGYVSDYLLHTRGWARPLLMAVTLAIMAAGHIVISSGFSGNLYVGSILVGICYGSQWSLMPTITSEIFGIRHMGTIFNTISIASPIGSYIFSVRVIGYIYDKEASAEDSCNGTHCFMLSFLIMASVAFFGFLIALGLFFRTRGFYSSIVLKRLRHSP